MGKEFDNVNDLVYDDLKNTIKKGVRVSIVANTFSMYAYEKLKKELELIEDFRFIFAEPTFLKEDSPKKEKEFYIPRLKRETSLYGTEFEVKLRNELTQKAVARECTDWIKRKAIFKSNKTKQNMKSFYLIENEGRSVTYNGVDGFTTVDLGCETGNQMYSDITSKEEKIPNKRSERFVELWNNSKDFQDVTEEVIENMMTAYNENSPEFIYYMTLFHVFNEFLEDISEDELPNEATGFKESKIWNMLYDFQRDAVIGIINKLEKYNGCILADSVGLGKTFTALAVMKYYENRNKSVLVLCPKKLADNWNTYKANYTNNPIASDRFNYDVLFHTDLSRNKGESNGLDLEKLNWENYDLVVIDESHNFRNGTGTNSKEHENRYTKLMNKVIKKGVKTKVLMLSATPVNNRLLDIKNQLAIAYEGNSANWTNKLNTKNTVEEIFKKAQREFNRWSKLEPEERTTEALLKELDLDFFELLDSVTIARSRKHIKKYYNSEEIGHFPERLKPITLRPHLTDIEGAINYNEIYEELTNLSLHIYTPSEYIHPSKEHKYLDIAHNKGDNLTQRGREAGIRKLMSINLLKRLESSVNSFKLTLERIKKRITDTLEIIDNFEGNEAKGVELENIIEEDLDIDDTNVDEVIVGSKVKISLNDMDYLTWKVELLHDLEVLDLLTVMIAEITPKHDRKLQELLNLIDYKIRNPINAGNKKIIIFSAFSDTAEYLYEHVSEYVKDKYGLNTAMITGTVDGKTTIKGFKATLNNVLTFFSPISKEKNLLFPNDNNEIDILIATDCISEGQNLQDCDYLINYDIHWNPVRLIQRFGRIDRIGSKNNKIQLVNFWPDLDLDEYINLKNRVETRMKITVMTSTGDDDIVNEEEKGELEYRKRQLERLQEEVVDIEEMSDGISIMDLGLNEFRLDLLDYIKNNDNIDKKPKGMHAVASATEELTEGVIFILRNINNNVNIDDKNRIHPFYMVYVNKDGEVICDYLNPKRLLDNIRLLCRGKKEPIKELYQLFNKETDDGRNMKWVSTLLSDAIHSIIDTKEESDIDSLFSSGGTSALSSSISGLEDFELICFLVVK